MDPAEPAQPETPDTPAAPDSLPPHPTLTEYFRQLGPVVGLLILLSLSAPAIFGTFVLGYGAVSAFSANANFDDPAAPDYHPLAGDWAGEGLALKIIRGEVPYNPLQIMREASRIAVEAGVKDGEMWSLDNYGACVGDGTDVYATTFFSQRRHDVDPGDADKLAALDVLARVCEYIERRNR